jgi:acyl carrier protein
MYLIKEVDSMAERTDVAERVKEIVVERLDRKPEEVTMEARFIDDLGADSLDITELLMALEEEFDIEIDDEANQIESLADAVRYIEAKL